MVHFMSKETRHVLISVIVASMSGFCFGFDTGSSGSLTTMDSFYAEFGHISETMRGVVVAMLLLTSALTGVIAGSVSDTISRKRTISLGCFIFAVGQAASAATSKYIGVLILGRIIAGLGEGLFFGTLSTYVSEITPKHTRGIMLVITQCGICLGVSAGFFCSYGSSSLQPSSLSWRLPFIVNSAISFSVGVGAIFIPYSPRWLLLHNRREEAEEVLRKLCGDTPAGLRERRELMSAGDPAQAEKANQKSKRAALSLMFKPRYRWRTILGLVCNIGQMLTGIDFVLFYAPLLFTQAGLDPDTASFIASGATGLVLVASTLITAAIIGRVGRRPLFIWGCFGVVVCLFIIGILYASGGAYTEGGKYAVVIFIEVYALWFGATLASVTRMIASEIQPSETRAAATSFGQGMNQLVNFAIALSGPVFLEKSSVGPYFFYGSITAALCLFTVFFLPETRNKSLEEIAIMFESTGVPLGLALPSFMTGVNSPLAGARVVASKVKEHRQRRESRSQSQSLGGEESGIRLRRPSRRRSSAGNGVSPARQQLEDVDEDGVVVEKEDPRAAFRREMLQSAQLGNADSAIEE